MMAYLQTLLDANEARARDCLEICNLLLKRWPLEVTK